MADAPLLIDIDKNIGPEKDPNELILLDVGSGVIGGLTPEARAEMKDARPGAQIGVDSNIGPDKRPGELILSILQDEDDLSDLYLSPFAQEFTEATALPDASFDSAKDPGANQILEERASLEVMLGLNAGDLSDKNNFAGSVFLSRTVGPNRDENAAPDPLGQFSNLLGDKPAAQKFESIDDFNLTEDQMQRYLDLVDQGEINPDELFQKNQFNPIAHLGTGASGITAQQALLIVMGNDREGISKYNPVTKATWTERDLDIYNKLQAQLLQAQGFRPLNLNTTMGVGKQRFNFQLLPMNERNVRPSGEVASGIRSDGMSNVLTLEEQLLVSELLSGQARLYGDPRSEANKNNPDINETVLFGDYVL